MEAYRGFAQVYDLLMDDFDYAQWAAYYMDMLARAGVKPRTLCDCACGTGSMTVELARYVPHTVGMDISAQMLELAQEKARQRGMKLPFVRMDMCALTLPRPVDAIVCACDGVNYLTSREKLRAFFQAAHNSLKPGGALAFDVSSAYKLKDLIGNAFFGEERDDVAYLWQNTLEDDTVTMDLSFFIRQTNGLYKRVAETHRQRAHEIGELTAFMHESGFSDICIYGDRSFDPPSDRELRIHICALRNHV